MDWLRTIRSTLGYFGGSSRIQGGSTITQQVIKNLTGNDEVTPERKVQEIFTALKLEKNYSKEQILETYLNWRPTSTSLSFPISATASRVRPSSILTRTSAS